MTHERKKLLQAAVLAAALLGLAFVAMTGRLGGLFKPPPSVDGGNGTNNPLPLNPNPDTESAFDSLLASIERTLSKYEATVRTCETAVQAATLPVDDASRRKLDELIEAAISSVKASQADLRKVPANRLNLPQKKRLKSMIETCDSFLERLQCCQTASGGPN